MQRIFVAEEAEQLLNYAKQEFELNSRSKGKSSLKDQLESIKRQGGKIPEEYMNLLECPVYFQDLWSYFLQLNNKRSSNGFGVNPINYTEILSLCKLKGILLYPYEIDIIMQLDNICLDQYAKEQKQEQEKSKQGRK